jgi:hypothetical protein
MANRVLSYSPRDFRGDRKLSASELRRLEPWEIALHPAHNEEENNDSLRYAALGREDQGLSTDDIFIGAAVDDGDGQW